MLTYFAPGNRDPKGPAIQPLAVSISLTLMLVVLWAFMHHYQGLARDGELYAVQASARLHPSLGFDLYLANTSQDRYSVFSRIYALFIESFGLQRAELLLFVVCTIWFLAAAWGLARELFSSRTAWLAVAMLTCITGYYGAYEIFHYAESYLTARSLAEPLVVTALAVHFRGSKRLALAIAGGALFIHPLMALPGMLLLICLRLPARQAILAAALGLTATFAIALAAATASPTASFLALMDAPWLEVVRERSQFLFLKYWHWSEWEFHVQAFLTLLISTLVLDDERIGRLCLGAVLVGAAGLGVTFIAGTIGPVALLVQGQAWRWFWVTGFVSVLLLAPTALSVWRDEKCGPICAILLISGWTFTPIHGTAAIGLALLLWSLRARIDARTTRLLKWAACALFAIIAAWILANSWSLVTSPRVETGPESLAIDRIRSIFNLQVSALLLFWVFWHWTNSTRSIWKPTLAAAFLAISLIWILPESFKLLGLVGTVGSRAEIEEFADWRNAIPPTSTVLIVPTRKSASFAWFTLERPSYLSVDQSSGVVFSRVTALEVSRRSQVLLPIMDPDWRILTQITQQAQGKKAENLTRPLTSVGLMQICTDPQLGFVIAKETLGFGPISHTHVGAWKDWNLYDCRRVRPPGAAT